MKKSVDKMVEELKETASKDDGEGEQKNEEVKEIEDEENLKKKEEVDDDKQEKVDEKLVAEAVTEEQLVKETNQKQRAEKAEVPTVECKKCMETGSAYTEKDEKFRTRDTELTKIEILFKDKCKEMFENEKVLKDNDEKLTQK
ncbi:uncharacterized protein LOC110943195 [Helianthus annuus]|uniref:uncharacterized protein LOC110943195 n=1 Tax=Helianthus annuus TaxID=4232 RepID=UPI000B909A1F|nr:uncharacterized protein LOC110943195 [Helianthus annuus]